VVKERVLILPPMPSLLDRTALEASHAFSDEANWLIPGKVMVGRYPGEWKEGDVERDMWGKVRGRGKRRGDWGWRRSR
jgi:hypothetical protein